MASLQVYLFGEFQIKCGDQVFYVSEGAKAQELLCYLLIYSCGKHRREQLASLFWEEHSTAHSKKYLRQTLWQIQNYNRDRLGIAPHRLLTVDADWVRLNPELDLWTDVSAFEQAYALLRPGLETDEESAQKLKEAVKLYRGDLLGGWYQDWCLYERERLQNMYFAMLDKLMAFCLSHHEYEAGLHYGARLLHCEPAHERTHQQMMRFHCLAGDRTAAMRQFDHCVEALKRELGVKPAKLTLALYEQICADQLDSATAPALASPSSLPAILSHLRQLQATMLELQQQIIDDIRIVEDCLQNPGDRR